MKKKMFWVLVFISSILLVWQLGSYLTKFLSIKQISGLKITSTPETIVFLDNEEVGKTPYQNDQLKPGNHKVILKTDDLMWQGMVSLNPQTQSVINRDINLTSASSSGEILILNYGKGVMVTSSPTDSLISIDGKDEGQTPLNIEKIQPGEHSFLISHQGYLKRNIKAIIPAGMKLSLDVELAVDELSADTSNLSLATPTPTITQKVLIKNTPTGFLRVRSGPSLKNTEIGRISSGEKPILLEVLSGWYKIKLDDGQEGYISSSYVSKI